MQTVQFNLENDPVNYILTYDFNEIADAESVANCNLLVAIANIYGMSATQMRGLVYACLKPAHPQVLLAEAGGLLTRDSGTVMTALAKVLGADDADAPKVGAPKVGEEPKADEEAPAE